MSILIIWLVAITYGILVQTTLLKVNVYWKFENYVYNGFVVLFTIVVYVFIGVTATRSARRLELKEELTHDKTPRYRNLINKKIYIPLYITLSFLLLQFAPPIIIDAISYDEAKKQIVTIGLIGINMLNNVSDPLIYVILSRR